MSNPFHVQMHVAENTSPHLTLCFHPLSVFPLVDISHTVVTLLTLTVDLISVKIRLLVNCEDINSMSTLSEK